MTPYPMAMQMRFLQALADVASDQNSTIVFPLPLELLGPFLRTGRDGAAAARAIGSNRGRIFGGEGSGPSRTNRRTRSNALGAGLYSIRIPQNSIVQYETEVKSGKLLLVAHGTADEVEHARNLLHQTGAETATVMPNRPTLVCNRKPRRYPGRPFLKGKPNIHENTGFSALKEKVESCLVAG